MPSEFDAATAVTPAGEGLWRAEISGAYNIGNVPNGGYLLALGTRAVGESLVHPTPLTVTGHFVRPAAAGPAEITTEVVRSGRNLATGQGRLSQAGRECMRLLATFGDLSKLRGPTRVAGDSPCLPPPEDCAAVRGPLPRGLSVSLTDSVEIRSRPGTPGWASGSPRGTAELDAWVRFTAGRPPDPMAMPLLVDALPPAVFELGYSGWVPTLELTVHVRAVPARGWLRLRSCTRFLIEGMLDEDVEVWDADGRLVAQSRQLARLTAPPEPTA